MPSTISLGCSKKIHALLGDAYETERKWVEMTTDGQWTNFSPRDARILPDYLVKIGAPDFAETIRLLPKIAEKKPFFQDGEAVRCDSVARTVAVLLMDAPSEEEGMERVSEYLEKIL